jgi:ATP-binding cassette, subfamily B, bacterial
MKPVSFHRARSYGQRLAGASFIRWLYALASVVLTLALLETLGLWTESLVFRGDSTADGGGSSALLRWARPWYARSDSLENPTLRSPMLLLVGLALAALLSLTRVALARAARRRAEDVATHLRAELQRRMFHLEAAELVCRGEIAVVDLFANGCELTRQALVAWWLALPHDMFLLIGLACLAIAVHPWVGLAAVLVVCLGILLVSTLDERWRTRQAIVAEQAALRMAGLIENLRQVRLVSGHLLEEVPGHPFAESLELYRRAALIRQHGDDRGKLVGGIVLVTGGALLAWLAGANVLRQPPTMDVASVVVLTATLACAAPPLRRLRDLPRLVERAEPAAEAVFAYLDRSPSVGQSSDARPMSAVTRGIDLYNVTVIDRTGRRLLDQVTLSIPARGRIAIVAAEPDMPLALASLLPRFRDPHAGEVRVDGVDVRKFTIESLRARIALLQADNLLFNGTVAENIGCGNPRYSPQQIAEAAKTAQANDFILRLPDGFDTAVGEHTSRLEPWDTFRIGLARVLLRSPDVIIVDEPPLPPDSPAADLVDRALQAVLKDRTSIILARRLATLRGADRILLFHDGKLRAEGTHADLLQQSDLYRHLVYVRYNEHQPV